MVALLNHFRLLHPSGFHLFTASTYVQLGLTTTTDAFRCMVARVLGARAANYSWPADVSSLVSAETVMGLMAPTGRYRGVVSQRLALVAYLSSLFGDDFREDVPTLMEFAWEELVTKLVDESLVDTAVALMSIGPADWLYLRAVAQGLPSNANYDVDGAPRKAGMFMCLLCDRRYSRGELLRTGP